MTTKQMKLYIRKKIIRQDRTKNLNLRIINFYFKILLSNTIKFQKILYDQIFKSNFINNQRKEAPTDQILRVKQIRALTNLSKFQSLCFCLSLSLLYFGIHNDESIISL